MTKALVDFVKAGEGQVEMAAIGHVAPRPADPLDEFLSQAAGFEACQPSGGSLATRLKPNAKQAEQAQAGVEEKPEAKKLKPAEFVHGLSEEHFQKLAEPVDDRRYSIDHEDAPDEADPWAGELDEDLFQPIEAAATEEAAVEASQEFEELWPEDGEE